jgi:hypothetical protein
MVWRGEKSVAIITHKLAWDKCLSHQIWPAIEKGWKDEGKDVHFFWGLAGNNIKEINDCEKNGEEWWFVDVGYFTEQITRYPEPSINNYDNTYFRIVKGGLHTTEFSEGNTVRINDLFNKGIDVEFKGWYTGDTKHILLAPSSQMVTHFINGVSQEDWIKQVTADIRVYTDRPIKVRNKPRPNNEFWNTDIKEDLKNCHCLVTNLSLSAIDAILNKVPIITHKKNVCSPLSTNIANIENIFRINAKTVTQWMRSVVDHQFTIKEMENGTAYKYLND